MEKEITNDGNVSINTKVGTEVENKTEYPDQMESIIHYVPVVLPVAGAVLMFLLAFIAIYMA